MTNLTQLKTLRLDYIHQQMDIIHFMQTFYRLDKDELRKMTWLYRKSGIEKRYSALPDFNIKNKALLFKPNIYEEVGLESRLDIYNQAAFVIGNKLLSLYDKDILNKVTHLITISCTGITAPGLELKLQRELLPQTSQRAINFMGCYAAIHGLKQAQEITISNPNASVLVVDIELCTLHFQYSTKPDLMNSAMIFGDGAAAWIMNGAAHKKPDDSQLSAIGSYSFVLHNEADKMAWFPTSTGFLMQLSSYIPEIIGNNIKKLVAQTLSHFDIKDTAKISWCIHPGGLSILNNIKKALNLSDFEMVSSYEILKEYGNMSSPTVMYVLERMLAQNRIPKGNKVVLMAFGPGLSIETFVFQA